MPRVYNDTPASTSKRVLPKTAAEMRELGVQQVRIQDAQEKASRQKIKSARKNATTSRTNPVKYTRSVVADHGALQRDANGNWFHPEQHDPIWAAYARKHNPTAGAVGLKRNLRNEHHQHPWDTAAEVEAGYGRKSYKTINPKHIQRAFPRAPWLESHEHEMQFNKFVNDKNKIIDVEHTGVIKLKKLAAEVIDRTAGGGSYGTRINQKYVDKIARDPSTYAGLMAYANAPYEVYRAHQDYKPQAAGYKEIKKRRGLDKLSRVNAELDKILSKGKGPSTKK